MAFVSSVIFFSADLIARSENRRDARGEKNELQGPFIINERRRAETLPAILTNGQNFVPAVR